MSRTNSVTVFSWDCEKIAEGATMRQHINIGSNVNGNQSYGSIHASVAGCVDMARMRPGKRLTRVRVPVVSDCSERLSSRESLSDRETGTRTAAGRGTGTWPCPAFEPPAPAWAALVISRAISL